MRILIADDEPDIRETLAEVFEDEGFSVAMVANGAEALAWLRCEDSPCVVILDLMMPVISGQQVYAEMLKDERLRKVPVIISTSDPTRAPAGPTLMPKPVDLHKMIALVKKLCA